MKVRIVKAKPIAWYADQIGCTLNVETHSDGINYSASFIGQRMTFFILADDCEILPEENQPEPFDLERALNGEKVVNGTTTGEFKFSYCNGNFKYCCFLFEHGNCGYCLFYCSNTSSWHHTPNGSYYTEGDYIKMAPRESEYVTKWVNVFDQRVTDDTIRCSSAYHSKERALENRSNYTNESGYIGTFPITYKRLK